MNYTRNYTGPAAAMLLVAPSPHEYWWVMRVSNPPPLPCEGWCAANRPLRSIGETLGLTSAERRWTAVECTGITQTVTCSGIQPVNEHSSSAVIGGAIGASLANDKGSIVFAVHPARERDAPRDGRDSWAFLLSRPSGRVVAKHNTHRAGTHDSGNQTRRNGTGQLPACDLVGWLKTEAQGCRRGNNDPAHTVYPQGGEAASSKPLIRQGKGGLSGEVIYCSKERTMSENTERAVPAGWKLVPDWKGYALLGTGNYVINHSADFDPELGAELLITLATDADRTGGRQIGESRDNPNDAPPIQADDMVIRIGFLNERALFALEDQLRMLRAVHFAEGCA